MTEQFIDFKRLRVFLENAAEQYEKTAPVVESHIDNLYRRLDTRPETVSVREIMQVSQLLEDGEWMHPNYAANMIYHLRERLGMDTTGQIGF